MTSYSRAMWFVPAAAAVAALASFYYVGNRFRKSSKDGDDTGKGNVDFKDGSQESLVNERFQACVQVMGPQLSRLPQRTQLDYYGLFKQGTLGDCSEYQSEPPPAYDLVATAKYQAWASLAGMDRMTAMQNYIDKALHFQFTKHLSDGEDDELEGNPAMDIMGLGDKPSTLLSEFDKETVALQDSQYPMHAAAREGNLEDLKMLIESTKVLASDSSNDYPNTLDAMGQTPLHLASDRGHFDCVKALILGGSDINAVDNDGISILQAAVIGGDEELCKMLLLLGADPDHVDNDGDTPRDSVLDDAVLKELFQNFDDKVLTSEDLDPAFREYQQGNPSITVPPETSVDSERKPEKTNVKDDMKVLDEDIDVDLDDDGDMF